MKRITIISGHYGSGKSEISLNLAINNQVDTLVDLDIINPYFRSRSMNRLLEEHDIYLVESTIKGMTNSDLPYVSGEGRLPFVNKDMSAIYDLGGTELGAKVLIQFQDAITDFSEIDFFVVVNINRPETNTSQDIIKSITLLEAQTQLKVTGLINNSNMMKETTANHIQQGQDVLKHVSEELSIPIVYTVIEEHLDLNEEFEGDRLTLKRYIAKQWL